MTDDKSLLRGLFLAAVNAADPLNTIPKALPDRPDGRVLVVGAGKASARMAEIVEHKWGPCEGLVLTRYGYGRPTKGIEVVEAAHPVPDEAGAMATQRMLALLDDLGEEDFVLALISGGASSLLCAPRPPMTLTQKQVLHRDLLASGAPVSAMNLIRKHCSSVKGGQLAAAAYPARMLSLIVSDVAGDHIGEIGSGPTAGEAQPFGAAIALAEDAGVTLPQELLEDEAGSTVLCPDDPRLNRVCNRIISAPSQSLLAARRQAEQLGLEVVSLGDAIEGEARETGADHARLALDTQRGMAKGAVPVLLLSGGECTVTGRGSGSGGPNAEYALAAAIALQGASGISLIACDTDGVDGSAEIAGAYADSTTLERAIAAGVSAQAALDDHDSHGFFGRLGDQIVTGPTLTNVNDFRAILVRPLS